MEEEWEKGRRDTGTETCVPVVLLPCHCVQALMRASACPSRCALNTDRTSNTNKLPDHIAKPILLPRAPRSPMEKRREGVSRCEIRLPRETLSLREVRLRDTRSLRETRSLRDARSLRDVRTCTYRCGPCVSIKESAMDTVNWTLLPRQTTRHVPPRAV